MEKTTSTSKLRNSSGGRASSGSGGSSGSSGSGSSGSSGCSCSSFCCSRCFFFSGVKNCFTRFLFGVLGWFVAICNFILFRVLWNRYVIKLRNRHFRTSSLRLIERQKALLEKLKLEYQESLKNDKKNSSIDTTTTKLKEKNKDDEGEEDDDVRTTTTTTTAISSPSPSSPSSSLSIEPSLDNRTVITFSPGGTLWAYFTGVIAYLRDHFEVQELMQANLLRLGGISCGTSAAITIFFNLSVVQAFQFGMEWQRLFDSRFLRFWLLDTRQVMFMIIDLFHRFGIDDKLLQEQKHLSLNNNVLYFGLTQWQLWPWKYEFILVHSFQSLKELVYAATCSMRTLPFFRRPGKWNKSLVFDGGFSSWFAIPEDASFSHTKILRTDSEEVNTITATTATTTPTTNPEVDCVLRVSVIHTPDADICPPKTFTWPLQDWCTSGTLQQNIERFQLGYLHASNFNNINTIIEKGLPWKHSLDPTTIVSDKWNTHIEQRIDYHSHQLKTFFSTIENK